MRRALGLALVLGAFVALLVLGYQQQQRQLNVHVLEGWTMGSTWRVSVAGPRKLELVALKAAIETELGELDRQLSGYRDTAELAQLNRSPIGVWRALPPHLGAVLRFGEQLNKDTGGAFDLSVKPLVNLWGFGVAEPRTTIPTEVEIAAARARLGSDMIELSADGKRVRRRTDVTIDVDAIAPGYAADIVSELLRKRGLPDHLVDIGGELKAAGHRPDGGNWRIGVEEPELSRGKVARIINLTNIGVATSGDYRDYVEIGGRRYSHTIDPTTGWPVAHDLASVTVLAPTALAADGYATTLMVLGPKAGMAWADARGLAVFMLIRNARGEFFERYNAAFAPNLVTSAH